LQGDERAFAQAMASSASLGARETARRLDLRGVRSFLDLGGGPGVYAIEAARRQGGLRAVVFDSAKTLEVARDNIERAGLADRIQTRAGDALRDDLGAGYDLILLSNVIHAYAAQDNQRLVGRAAAALAPGGRLAVKDFLLGPDRTQPARAAMFAVNMLVATEGGDCYSVSEVREWLRAAGLQPERVIRLTPPSRMVVGRDGQEARIADSG
jgi:cyclopropane fatty-acyl-phospholipid synthase-like methyltransferase